MRMRRRWLLLAGIVALLAGGSPAEPGAASDRVASPQPCRWLSAGELAYVDRAGLVVCSSRSAFRVTRDPNTRELLWSTDGTRLHYALSSKGSERHYALDAKSRSSIALDDDCGFAAFTWCVRYPGTDGSELTISRPPQLPGGRSQAAEVATLRSHGRAVSIRGGLPDEFLPLSLPKAGRVVIFHAPEIGADEWVDGMPLSVLDLDHGERRLAVRAHGIRPWAALSPDGATLVATVGGFRDAITAKTLVRCDLVEAVCHPWQHRAGFVELDPVYSPDGTRVAFVRAADVGEARITSGYGTMPEPWALGRRLMECAAAEPGPAAVATSLKRVESPAWIGPNRLAFISQDRLYDIQADGTTHLRISLAPHEAYYGDDEGIGNRYAWHP